MVTELDIWRVAHLMLHEYGGQAENEAARYADVVRGQGNWDALLTWMRIRQTISMMHQVPTGLPN